MPPDFYRCSLDVYKRQEFYLIRKTGQIPQHITEFRLRYRMLYPCKFHGKQIEGNELRAVGFGSGNRDFRARPGIDVYKRQVEVPTTAFPWTVPETIEISTPGAAISGFIPPSEENP